MKAPNPFLKSRKPGNAYAVCLAGGWRWEILKVYKGLEASMKDPYARAFCFVSSPMCPDGEYGDVYLSEIPGAYSALAAAKVVDGPVKALS